MGREYRRRYRARRTRLTVETSACKSARGPDADRHRKTLISLRCKGSQVDADTHLGPATAAFLGKLVLVIQAARNGMVRVADFGYEIGRRQLHLMRPQPVCLARRR